MAETKPMNISVASHSKLVAIVENDPKLSTLKGTVEWLIDRAYADMKLKTLRERAQSNFEARLNDGE